MLYTGELRHFRLEERGNHGSNSFDRFDSHPDLRSFSNSLKIAPTSFLEIDIQYNETLPEKYKRSTYNPAGVIAAVQDYRIDHFRDLGINLRARAGSFEMYVGGVERHQKSMWNYATPGNVPIIFSYIESHYENINGGLRYLSHAEEQEYTSQLSRITKPLLNRHQINVEGLLDYKNGKIRRNSPYHSTGRLDNFYQTLNPHFTPRIALRYGVRDNLQVEGGLAYITPYKYKYDYRRYNADTTTLFFPATYKLTDQFEIPCRVSYRPLENLELKISSDMKIGHQKLDYYQKNTDNSVSNYPTRELSYFIAEPTVQLTYLFDNNSELEADEFSQVSSDLLAQNQMLVELLFKKDFTQLNERDNNGAQNIIDPYNAFEHPLDYFVAGSEHALFSTGNTTGFAANAELHNYFILEGGTTYGVTDRLNAEARVGYHSGTQFHHFVVNEIQSRYYNIKPYYYFDLGIDWRVTDNSLISIRSHIVPVYKTFMTRANDSKSFYQRTAYFDIAIMWQILFG
ncbi:hypothetical protein N9934_00585 [Desulfosarcina sp.]|nr:hypothetical protein [Desulfosarcina sp.]